MIIIILITPATGYVVKTLAVDRMSYVNDNY